MFFLQSNPPHVVTCQGLPPVLAAFYSRQGVSTYVLFADIASAFYCAITQLVAAGSDEDRGSLLDRLTRTLRLSDDDRSLLEDHLNAPTTLARANADPWIESTASRISVGNWFVLQGDVVPISTFRGSRPGSSCADVVFALLVPRLLESRDMLRNGPNAPRRRRLCHGTGNILLNRVLLDRPPSKYLTSFGQTTSRFRESVATLRDCELPLLSKLAAWLTLARGMDLIYPLDQLRRLVLLASLATVLVQQSGVFMVPGQDKESYMLIAKTERAKRFPSSPITSIWECIRPHSVAWDPRSNTVLVKRELLTTRQGVRCTKTAQ